MSNAFKTVRGLPFIMIPKPGAAFAAETAASAASVVLNFRNAVPLGLLLAQQRKKMQLLNVVN